MNWKIAWHQVAIALLIGFAGGAAFGQWYVKEVRYAHHWKHGDMKQHMIDRLSSELQLTPVQKAKIVVIFDVGRKRMMALHKEVHPKFEMLRNSTQQEIRRLLNSDQQKKFDELNARMEERMKKRGFGFGHRPPPPDRRPPPEEPPF